MPYAFAILGPPAWLLWGAGATTYFFTSTAVVVLVAAVASMLAARFPRAGIVTVTRLVVAVSWLIVGWSAWVAAF
jgi:hypothetical protein